MNSQTLVRSTSQRTDQKLIILQEIYTHACTHAHTHTYAHLHTHAHTPDRAHLYSHASTHTHTHKKLLKYRLHDRCQSSAVKLIVAISARSLMQWFSIAASRN